MRVMKNRIQYYVVAALIVVAGLVAAIEPSFAATVHHFLAANPLAGVGGMAAIGALSPGEARVIDPILSEVVQGYVYPDLVGSRMFPEVPVDTRGGQIIAFGKEAFEQYNIRRAPGGATKRLEIGYSGDKYAVVEDSVEAKVPFEILQDAERVPGINLAQAYMRVTMEIVRKGLEVEQAGIALDASRYGANNKVALSGTSKWSDASSNPTTDMDDYREAVRQQIGIYPNRLLLSAQAYKAARTNPNIVDRFKYTGRDSITADLLAHLWDLDEVVVGKAVTYDPDAGTMTDVWGNNAVLFYAPDGPSTRQQPSFGYTYKMRGNPYAEEPYRDRNAKSWIYPMTYERVPVVTSIDSGFLIQTPA